jgi:hypothetical protein
MPGLDYYKTSESSEVATTPSVTESVVEERSSTASETSFTEVPRAGVYYNPRLDPKNFLDGPLSWDAATRLRQMLARPGIVVRTSVVLYSKLDSSIGRLPQVFATASVPDVHSKPASTAYIRVVLQQPLLASANQMLPLRP